MYFVKAEDALKAHQDEPEEELEHHEELIRGEQGKIPPLNIVIFIVGSRGDVQPFIALGKGLKAAGHRVRLATHVNFKDFVGDNGLEFYPLKGNPEQLMNFMVNHPEMITLDPSEISKQKRMMEDIYFSTWEAATGLDFKPDVIISNPPVHVHVHLSQRLQIPLIVMFTMPWAPTKDYMHPMAPAQSILENKQSYAIVDRMIWMGLGGAINDYREKIGLSKMSRGAFLINKLKIPQVYCMSPHLAPKPSDWGQHIDVVGFWYLDLVTNYKPDEDLVKFLEAGEPPVYIGFGSIVVDHPKQLGQNVIEGLKKSGARALVSPGWAKIGEGMDLPENIKLIGAIPHDWLFPRCSAAIHHGGAGTTAAGLKAGCPTLVVPFFGDQPFWGSCVARMGVGPDPIPHKKLNADNLAEAVRFLLKPEVRQKAKELGEKLRTEDGVANAVEVFHRRLPIQDGIWTEEVYENQRKILGLGWTHKTLPTERPGFTDKTGLLELDKARFGDHPGWEWVDNDWVPAVVEGSTDKEGWRYGTLFLHYGPHTNWTDNEGHTDFVRSRKLTRRRKYVGITAPQTDKQLLFIDVIEAKNLPAKDLVGHSDPFCTLKVESSNVTQLTHVIDNNANPVWKETLWFEVKPSDTITLQCWDKDLIGQDLIGTTTLAVNDLLSKVGKDEWVPISDKKSKECGTIHLKYHVGKI